MSRCVGVDRGRAGGAHGFVLPAVAALLIVGSVVVLPFARPVSDRDDRVGRALAATSRLVAARDALLAYTAAYPDLYGPTGAGPGHLPCPDTDDTFGLAGPNPPCGSGRGRATGHVPGHVTVGRARVGIDAAVDGPPIRYRVATRVVNNPARRPLTIERKAGATDVSDADDAVAELLLPGSAGRPDRVIRLHAAELANAAEHRVAAWLVERAGSKAVGAVGATPSGEAPGGLGTETAATDELDVLSLVVRRVPASTARDGSVGLIDGVPQARHWFVLDDWSRVFRATVAPPCIATDPAAPAAPAAMDAGRAAAVAGTASVAAPVAASVAACAWRVDATARRLARRHRRPLPRAELRLVPVHPSGDGRADPPAEVRTRTTRPTPDGVGTTVEDPA